MDVVEINLPSSKSECNRLMVIACLAGKILPVFEGECEDIADMRRCIKRGLEEGECYVKESGTALRFLTALFAVKTPFGRSTVIRCGGRLAQRPLDTLIEALVKAGMPAPVVEVNEKGEKSIRIESSHLKGGSLTVPTSVSTQYASALLLTAPYMQEKVKMTLTGKNKFSPYIDMTVKLMLRSGALLSMEEGSDEKKIIVEPSGYTGICDVEADWSAASFFYEYVALNGGSLLLRGLKSSADSLQGDSRIAGIFNAFGVTTECKNEGVLIEKKDNCTPLIFRSNMSETPDLVMPIVATCCFLGVSFILEGVETLRHKESDRLKSVCDAMRDMGFDVSAESGNTLIWRGDRCIGLPSGSAVRDASDHRVAMAIEAACKGYRAEHPDCVEKSFPDFYKELNKLK